MRSGMPIKDYVEDLETIVADINKQTNALIVLVGTYHQMYGKGGNDPQTHPTWVKWDYKLMKLYNSAIRLVAQEHNALFVDAQAVFGGADWTLHPDACHLNDLGHVLIGNAIFQTIAISASGMAAKTMRIIEENDVITLNTGGSDTDDDIQQLWQAGLERYARQAQDQADS